MPDALMPLPTAGSFSYIGAQSIWRYPISSAVLTAFSTRVGSGGSDKVANYEMSMIWNRFARQSVDFTYVPKPIAGMWKPDDNLKVVWLLIFILF